jgi:DHA1 family bicyclomycin/chloramphenicol resistance-like MFS transporter
LLTGLALYTGFSLVAALSPSFDLLLAARVLQGIGAAATRAIPMSIVRDRYEGRTMARVMSLTSLVFMAAPIVAPSLGQLVLALSSWPWLFGMLAGLAVLVMIWTLLRLPETLHPQDRLPIQPARIAQAFAAAARNRTALCYTLSQTLLFGGLFGFINSAQQVVAEALGASSRFALVFALSASFIAIAALVNARLVMRLGMRRLSHAALLAFIALALLHLAVAGAGRETLVVFIVLQALSMFCYGLTGGNFAAMAMEPMGHLAGVASAFQGFIIMVGGGLIGFVIGQKFNGTVAPVEMGYLLCGLFALVCALVAEHGRLFRGHEGGVIHPVMVE